MQTPPTDNETPDADTTLAEYFARDPMRHTDQSLDGIIAHLRTQRKRFKMGDKTAGNPKPKTKGQKAQQVAMDLGKDILGDMEL